MTDKIYKVVLLGKIAEGYDVEIVHEKLAIIFDIDLKKIPKLLKKPIIIRKNLTSEVALKYQAGLEKIGVFCEIHPPLKTDSTTEANLSAFTEENLSAAAEPELSSILTAEETAELTAITEPESDQISPPTEPQKFSILDKDKHFVLSQETLRVINFKMSWWSLTRFSIKWILAAIPAIIILAAIVYLLTEATKVVVGLL